VVGLRPQGWHCGGLIAALCSRTPRRGCASPPHRAQQWGLLCPEGAGTFLGTRGGLYPETSAITVTGADVLPKLQAQAEAAARLLGFTPTSTSPGAPQLPVTLAELKYQSPKDNLYVTEATIGATIRADVANANRRYSGRYGASLDQRFGMAPNQETNTKLVGDVLSDALTRLFKDPAVGQLLAD